MPARRLWIAWVALSILGSAHAKEESVAPMPPELMETLEWRGIGPYRGGRSCAVAGIPSQRDTYYFGATGGGVWKTTDAGRTWNSVSDGFFGGSIGAVSVSESDPNVVYVGGGEKTIRGNVSSGDGMWRSTDAGKTWTSIGLEDSRHISRIRIHPQNPDHVYVAVMGHLSGPNAQRGVFETRDGGATWERRLFISEEVGAVDLIMDPSNPRILYASMWRFKRTPYSMESGGEGCGLFKSTDSGATWEDITRNEGLPKDTVGIIGVTVSAARPERVWAIIENADNGGVFRSDNGGETWTKTNSDRSLRQRAWYYSRLYADTVDPEVLYVLNVGFYKSKDGGKTFSRLSTPHGDNHDMWIDPVDPLRMIEANDGGANVSEDGGLTWSRQDNQATAQFYRVSVDNHFPYRIYGAQQDNSTVRILSRSPRGSIGERDWEPTAGGESGHIAAHPLNPDIVYGGSYGGFLVRVNHATGERRSINVWPENPMGWGAEGMKYRFQWNFPIFFSPHDPNTIYTAGNVLFKSTNEGHSWEMISPDLTRNEASMLGPSGGPITKDNTGVEYYCTIFAALESPHEPGVLWCGSDDGLIHVSRDAGKSWDNVTPSALPEWTMINSIEAHPFEPGGLYVAATRYKLDDFEPHLYRTTDYGKTWTRIDDGIDRSHFTRVVRADPERPGLLYAGTERGVYVSFDDGARWQSLQLELPIVPITDLVVKEGDLVAATQGRSFWVLDDLAHLRQLDVAFKEEAIHMFEPEPAYRMGGGRFRRGGRGQNPPGGVVIRFRLAEEPAEDQEVSLTILESDGDEVKVFSTKSKKRGERLKVEAGMNRFEWNMTYPGAEDFPGMVMWAAGTRGPRAVPGTYVARLKVGEEVREQKFKILKDPRSTSTVADIEKQFEFLVSVRDKVTETHRAIKRIRSTRGSVKGVLAKAKGAEDLKKLGDEILEEMDSIEKALYQTKNESSQDPLNFPIRLNNKLAALSGGAASGDYPPTEQLRAVKRVLVQAIDEQLSKLDVVEQDKVTAFNKEAAKIGVPHVEVKKVDTDT